MFNQCVVVSLFWGFYSHLRHGNIHGGHWFARRSFFSVWGWCNFLILLLSADLNAVLLQPSQVVRAHSAPHVAWESSYLSCLYFCICSPPTLIGRGSRRPSDLLVSPQPLHAGTRLRQYSRMSSALLNLILVVVLLFCFLFYSFYYCGNLVPPSFFPFMGNTPVRLISVGI